MGGTSKITENIIKLINAGANISFDASDKATDHLIEIATEAARVGVTVTFKNVGDKTTENLLRIIDAGKGKVALEL
jgi:hypothetical protein